MKNKERLQFNVTLNSEEIETIRILKEKYAINISGIFKIMLRQYKSQLLAKGISIAKVPKIGE